jgi:hypothetical protein
MRHRWTKSQTGWVGLALIAMMAWLIPTFAAASDEPWSEDRELAEIRQMIEENGLGWVAGKTDVSHYSPDVKQKMLGTRPTPEEIRTRYSNGEVVALPERDIPSSWDWRDLGGMTTPRQQGSCGSCWAFAATGAFESIIRIFKGDVVNLSEQQGLVCNDWGADCDGGWQEAVYWIQMTMGQVSEGSMGYNGNDNAVCIDHNRHSVERNQGYMTVPFNETSLKTAIMTAPIAVNMYAPVPEDRDHDRSDRGQHVRAELPLLLQRRLLFLRRLRSDQPLRRPLRLGRQRVRRPGCLVDQEQLGNRLG